MTREALPADRRQFLQHYEDVYLGNGVTANIRVFASEEMVRNMANHSDELDGIRNAFCDATFNSAPAGYLQYFTVHMKINNRLYPVFHVLMTHKHRFCYRQLFRFIRSFLHCPIYFNYYLMTFSSRCK